MLSDILGSKILSFVISFFYVVVFLVGYVSFLHPYYGYAGFGLNEYRIDNLVLLMWSVFLCLFPVFFLKKSFLLSYLISVLIYFSLYIPIQLTYFLDFDGEIHNLVFYQCLYAIGMVLIVCSGWIQVALPSLDIGYKVNVFYVLLGMMLCSMIWIFWKYGGNFRWVSFEEVYSLREENHALGSDFFTSYISSWLKYFIIPIVFAYGLFSKKYLFIFFAIISSLMIYMSTGAKSVLIQLLVMYLIFKFLRTNSTLYFFNVFGLGLIALLVWGLLVELNIYSAILWMRTIGNGGSLTLHYHYFFDMYPNTYFSHLNIVNAFTNAYPFGNLSLGQAVGKEYWSDKMNANANFWATDGLAAMGGAGILLSSLILSGILVILNSVSYGYKKLFILLCTFPALIFILNSSLFSALLSGGLIFLLFTLSISSVKKNRYIVD